MCPDRPHETMRGLARVILVCSFRYGFICHIVKLRQREHAHGRGCWACACLTCFQTECVSLKCASACVCRFHEPSYAHFLLVCTLRATFEASVLLIRGAEGRETHSAIQPRMRVCGSHANSSQSGLPAASQAWPPSQHEVSSAFEVLQAFPFLCWF